MNKEGGGDSHGLAPHRPWEGFGCSECDGNYCMDLGREETHSVTPHHLHLEPLASPLLSPRPVPLLHASWALLLDFNLGHIDFLDHFSVLIT